MAEVAETEPVEAPPEEAAADQPDATGEGESAEAPAEGADDVAPPTEDSPQAEEASAEAESSEEAAEGASEETKA